MLGEASSWHVRHTVPQAMGAGGAEDGWRRERANQASHRAAQVSP